ncbi:MAG TPA: sigma-70 family RNA polymerase sigma factor [Actinomycetota bacterium]|nr:sigma-70 family RNA polymerase sigma factor [Actinomycetota bacterium]
MKRERAWNTAQVATDDRLGGFESFFEAERDRLFRALCVITGSRHDAEDLAQEAFLKVWERWDRVGRMEDPAGYLHRTAMNTFRNRYRRTLMALRRTIGFAPSQDVYEVVDDRQVVGTALASLTARQRAALVLTEAFGYSSDDAGRMLGIKGSTVRALNFQARSALRRSQEDAR